MKALGPALLVALALVGCGDSPQTSPEDVRGELAQNFGALDSFEIPDGRCYIEDVYTGQTLDTYREDSNVLVSPDDSVGVSVGYFQGTTPESCEGAVRNALGWN